MKLVISPASPFARKIRIAAMELGLFDKIEFISPIKAIPVTPNDEYVQTVSPLRKIPALILDDGNVILDSYVIAEYLDELGGGKLIPASGLKEVAGQDRPLDHSGHARCAAVVPLRENVAAGAIPLGRMGRRPVQARRGTVWRATRHIPTSSPARWISCRSASSACSAISTSGFPIAAGAKRFRSSMAFHEKMMQRESVKTTLPPPA